MKCEKCCKHGGIIPCMCTEGAVTSPTLLVVPTYIAVSIYGILTIKPTRCTNFSNSFLEWNSTCFGQCLCPSPGVFHCTHSSGVSHTVLQTACEQDQDVPSWSCSQAVCKTVGHIPFIDVWTVKTSWWLTVELSEICRFSFQNKFEELVHLVGFIIRNLFRLNTNTLPFLATRFGFYETIFRPMLTAGRHIQFGYTYIHTRADTKITGI
jgi:hypothetical protein